MKRIFCLLFILITGSTFSQSDSLKGKNKGLYLTWGYTKAYYSKSTIHFKNHTGTDYQNNYDFTVYNATASDRPDLKKIKDVVNVTIPQFVFRVGYQVSDKWGLELNYDHTKYVVNDYQQVHVKGQIGDNWVDEVKVMDPDSFLHFEHTDGANFWMINLVRQFKIYNPNKNFQASWVVKPGAGVVIPRTDVTMFGTRLNNNWKLAGWIVGVETGVRLQFLRHGFFEFVGKGSFADYVNAFILGKGHGRANHHFFTAQMTATLGYQFGR
ncbi:MAG: hypothetical protein JNL60_09445 [Bacteroidia bacterium]|nr:hypothetical protein [Bacteroidia bacterium]